jgi:hypothetical protein
MMFLHVLRCSAVTQSLLALGLVLSLSACQGDDGYPALRRQPSTFQVADGPVVRYPIADKTSNEAHGASMNSGEGFVTLELKPQPMHGGIDELEPPTSPHRAFRLPASSASSGQKLVSPQSHQRLYHEEVESGGEEHLPERKVHVRMNDRDVQYFLKELGYYKGALDGKTGPQTRSAVIAFQKKRGLKPDGVVGPKTKRALVKALKEGVSSAF